MEKFIESLQEAEKIIKKTDHMMYITFPLIKDKRILLKILLDTKTSVVNCINSVLQYEYLFKRIKLYEDQKTNFKNFREKCAPRYEITKSELDKIIELFNLIKSHETSSVEFIRNNNLVILSDNQDPKIFSINQIKEFLILAKKILLKTKKRLLSGN